jgi:hypothetical protein
MKKYLLIIQLFLIYSYSTTLYSAGIQKENELTLVQKTKFIISPYPSCKKVKLISEEDFKKNTAFWNTPCPNGKKAAQVISSSGVFNIDIQNAIASLALLQEIGEKSLKVIDENILEKEKILKCFQQNEVANIDCDSIRKKEISETYSHRDEMRIELAMSEGKNPSLTNIGRSMTPKINYPSKSEMINNSLKKEYLGMKGVFRASDTPPLSPGEKFLAEDKLENEMDQIKSLSISDAEKFKLTNQLRLTHKMKYLEHLKAAPVLSELGSLPMPNNYTEINKKFSKAYSKLIEYAKTERSHMADIISAGKFEKLDSKNVDKKSQKHAKELLGLMAYGPIVEQLIDEKVRNKSTDLENICALATSLLQNNESAETRTELAKNGAIIAGGITLSALTAGMGDFLVPAMIPIIGGSAMTASTTAAIIMGPGFGSYLRLEANKDLNKAKGAVTTGVKDVMVIDQKDFAVALGNISMGTFDLLGTGAFKAMGNTVFKSFAKSALTAKGLSVDASEKLLNASISSDKLVANNATKEIDSAMKEHAKKVIGTENPNIAEMANFTALEVSQPEKEIFTRLGTLKSEITFLDDNQKLVSLTNKNIPKSSSQIQWSPDQMSRFSELNKVLGRESSLNEKLIMLEAHYSEKTITKGRILLNVFGREKTQKIMDLGIAGPVNFTKKQYRVNTKTFDDIESANRERDYEISMRRYCTVETIEVKIHNKNDPTWETGGQHYFSEDEARANRESMRRNPHYIQEPPLTYHPNNTPNNGQVWYRVNGREFTNETDARRRAEEIYRQYQYYPPIEPFRNPRNK